MLEINNLHVEVDGKEILKGVSLQFEKGKVHALMGPNGSGKSTLANTLMGHPKYTITSGKIILDGKDITSLAVDERAKLGLFLSFQHPMAVSGVGIRKFLRAIVNEKREKKLSVMDFKILLEEKMKLLGMDKSFASRHLNVGFSGGEKKRMEMLQMMLLEPSYALLDETDSGLDVDAIKAVVEGISLMKKQNEMGIIVITHYNKFLEYLNPDMVSVMLNGNIVATGGAELAKEIEEKGFGGFQ